MKRFNWMMSLALAIAFAANAGEKPADKDLATDPEKANADFKLQGEYKSDKLGAHVIAMGDGKFDAVFYPGGLPGDGWTQKEKFTATGAAQDGKGAVDSKADPSYSATFDGQTMNVNTNKGEKFELKKVMRQSPTLGAKAPDGAVVLFDGSNADAWVNGKMDERKFLKAGTVSKQGFTDFTLHVEFMLPFKPHGRGQDRGNSGVYLQNRYECQVLDSFGLEGKNNECGGLYTKAAPKVNMCFPPLSWQTYDIDFTAAKFDDKGMKTKNAVITAKHNGVIIHENFELDGKTGGGQAEAPTPGPIQFQDHGNPVFFRNIWVVEKK